MIKIKLLMACLVLMSCISESSRQNKSDGILTIDSINGSARLESHLISENLNGFDIEDKDGFKVYAKEIRGLSFQFKIADNLPNGVNGVEINGELYNLTASIESSQSVDDLKIYSLNYGGSSFIYIYSGYSPCNSLNCRKTRFNIFNVSNTKDIVHYSFDSIFGDQSTLADINNDKRLDIVKVEIDEKSGLNNSDKDGYYDYHEVKLMTLSGKGELVELSGRKRIPYSLLVRYNSAKSDKSFHFEIINTKESRWPIKVG